MKDPPPSSVGLWMGWSYISASHLWLHRHVMGWPLPLLHKREWLASQTDITILTEKSWLQIRFIVHVRTQKIWFMGDYNSKVI